jgi:hypothetical protein
MSLSHETHDRMAALIADGLRERLPFILADAPVATIAACALAVVLDDPQVTITDQPPKDYPYTDGPVLVLGPGVIATPDRSVINWKGENYVVQVNPENETSTE